MDETVLGTIAGIVAGFVAGGFTVNFLSSRNTWRQTQKVKGDRNKTIGGNAT